MATPPGPSRAFLGLGSNLGQRDANLRRALERLAPYARPLAVSPLYETEPWGVGPQPRFLNAVVSVEPRLSPRPLLAALKRIEADLGRQPGPAAAPRPIDLDILYYDRLVIDEPDLVIPHPRLHLRAFVLVPLADLAPDFVDPRQGRRVADLLAALPERELAGVRLAKREWT